MRRTGGRRGHPGRDPQAQAEPPSPGPASRCRVPWRVRVRSSCSGGQGVVAAPELEPRQVVLGRTWPCFEQQQAQVRQHVEVSGGMPGLYFPCRPGDRTDRPPSNDEHHLHRVGYAGWRTISQVGLEHAEAGAGPGYRQRCETVHPVADRPVGRCESTVQAAKRRSQL